MGIRVLVKFAISCRQLALTALCYLSGAATKREIIQCEKGLKPMSPQRQSLLLPVLLLAVGIGWLLTSLGVMPGIDWLWTSILAAIGVLSFVLSGFDKVTVVIGPFFVATSLLSILRQSGRLSLNIELPVLVILLGILFMVARMPLIPVPKWVTEEPKR